MNNGQQLETPRSTNTGPKRKLMIILIAAAILLLAGGVSYYLLSNMNKSADVTENSDKTKDKKAVDPTQQGHDYSDKASQELEKGNKDQAIELYEKALQSYKAAGDEASADTVQTILDGFRDEETTEVIFGS